MNHSTPNENMLSFYVVNNLNHEKGGDHYICHQNLTLPNAITLYNSYGAGKTSALGVMNASIQTDLVQRLDGESTLVSDYQQMDEWKHNPYLCISAVSLLIANLNIHRQMDAYCMTHPFEERLHIMRMKETEELRLCFLKSRETVQRLGKVGNPLGFQISAESRNRRRSILRIERRAAEPTMDKYDLIFSEPVKEGEAMVDVCNRYHLNSPTGYQGYAPPSATCWCIGCHALYIDSLGFELVERFVRPPGL